MSDKLYSEALSAAEMAFSNREFETALEYYQKALQEKADDIYTLSRAGCTCIALETHISLPENMISVLIITQKQRCMAALMKSR